MSADAAAGAAEAELVHGLSAPERDEALDGLSDRQARDLVHDWRFWARPNQLPPEGAWRIWLLLAGRGFGKTRTGAEWVRAQVEQKGARRIALVAPTAADVRDVMIEGESGLLAVASPGLRPQYEPSKRRLSWPNGAVATCFSAEEPNRLRGPQHDAAWCDELAAWRHEEAWDMLMLGLRLGADPRCVVTTTPKPIRLIRQLLGDRGAVVTRGSTCLVDGELVAFETATLTGAGRYDLSYLNRGLFGSPIGAHKAGSAFARLDGHVFQLPFTQDRIGQTVYLKFVSFNPYQGGLQQLAEVQPYTYTFQGSALASPLPIVQNLVATYTDSQTQISWDEIKDFRAVLYEIRLGASPQGGQILGRVAHPPFAVPGNGTYWVAAVSQPTAGLTVYSQQWSEIVVGSAVLNVNAIAAWSEAATGWKGSVTRSAFSDGLEIVLDYPANILGLGDWLNTPDILHIGQPGLSGSYQIPAAHEADAKYVAPCIVSISYAAIGQVPGANLLAVGDYLGTTDLLGNAASANIDVFPLIQLGDFNHVWGPWQKFVPGVYNARYFRAMAQLDSSDAQTQAILEDFSFAVYAPERIDDYIGIAVPAAGLALTYQPNGAAAPAPFNGGPGGAPLPQLQVTILGEQPGDTLAFSNQTLTGCTIRVLNGGAGVQRSANILAKGF